MDTAMFLAGVITAQEYCSVNDAEIFDLASVLYRRVDFEWLLNKDTGLLRMGWDPETGLFHSQWEAYDEEALLLLLGIDRRRIRFRQNPGTNLNDRRRRSTVIATWAAALCSLNSIRKLGCP
jgi:hypothetical protein